LRFDPVPHKYYLRDREIPGITKMLRLTGELGGVEAVPEFYRDRGASIHEWIEAKLTGALSPRTKIPSYVAPRFEALDKALAVLKPRVLGVERLCYNPAGPYATKVDMLVRWRGERWDWNIKTGAAWPFYGVQLALEALCFPSPPRRACLYLAKDGREGRLEPHTDPADFARARWIISEYRRLTAAKESKRWETPQLVSSPKSESSRSGRGR